ncbi:MAG: EAL domain-containing protein [Pseudomonadota bacterium]
MNVFDQSLRNRLALLLGRTPGKRLLVHEILSIQILSAGFIGLLAIASLYWGGQWILQDNYSRWAMQWTDDLNELGSPLYLSNDREALIRLESFIERYPEIERVSYYTNTGEPLFAVDNLDEPVDLQWLPMSRLGEAAALVGSEEPYIMQSDLLDARRFEILAPVWTESIAEDDLFSFDPESSLSDVTTQLVGVVGISLDFYAYHDRLLGNIRGAILVLVVLLFALTLYGYRALQRALKSFSGLEQPIRELAEGNLRVEFPPAEHREISDIVEALETTASTLSERNAELVELANHDSLTGLYNRRRFSEELRRDLHRIRHEGGSSALFFIDLDQFKYVNDLCGHPAGDRLICKVADELRQSVDRNAVVARFGGDEFAVLCPNANQREARDAAEAILNGMRRLAHIEADRVFHVHCSIGVTLASETNQNLDELVAQADIACREAKAAGRNRWRFYEGEQNLEERVDTDVGWMNRLRSAIDNDTFVLRFQPINEIHTGRTTHHEVLVRVPGEDGSLVSPDAFLPAAIRFGLMSEIDLWVIYNAAKAFAEHVRVHRGLKFAINISATAFESEDLPSYVESTFEKYSVDPSRIIFEITESLAILRPVHVEKQIARLRALGCELALDDFGTGYSSFSYLQQLDCDYLKIDGSFVVGLPQNPVDQKVIRLIADIGKEAGMKTIAEYVQDAKSLALLEELGVDMAQGYFVGRPAETPEFNSTPISLGPRRLSKSTQHGT